MGLVHDACLRCVIGVVFPHGEVLWQVIWICKIRVDLLGKAWPRYCPCMVLKVSWRPVHRLRQGPDMIGVCEEVLFLIGAKNYVHVIPRTLKYYYINLYILVGRDYPSIVKLGFFIYN